MLRSVLGDYLDAIKEREFDLPMLSLLHAMGFYDIHFTHGQVEFGKDFIAKRNEDGFVNQYSFQSKAGDINQAEWRNVQAQMLEAVINTLSHPQFDDTLPHQVVLVLTGRLVGNASLGIQNLNQQIERSFNRKPIYVWDREQLIEYLEEFDLFGIHHATTSEYIAYADFFHLYSKCLRGSVSSRDIELYSRHWLNDSLNIERRLLRSTVETEIFTQKLIEWGFYYETICFHLSNLRAVLYCIHTASDNYLLSHVRLAQQRLVERCSEYIVQFQSYWEAAGKDILQIENGPTGIVGYLVNCSRITEVAGLLYFLETDRSRRSSLISFLEDMIQLEPGLGRVVGDYHAVSLVFPVLALLDSDKECSARSLLRRSLLWLCERYEEGLGLAAYEASAYVETTTLLGYPFEFIELQSNPGSFLATVICDLAALLGDESFYRDVVNDIKATNIFPIYWQPADTDGVFRVESEDVVTYPNIHYEDHLDSFDRYEFAEHIRNESGKFRTADIVGYSAFSSLMLLLRDRYFPTLWSGIVSRAT